MEEFIEHPQFQSSAQNMGESLHFARMNVIVSTYVNVEQINVRERERGRYSQMWIGYWPIVLKLPKNNNVLSVVR